MANPSASQPVRLGVIGAGFISQVAHLHAIRWSPDLVLAALSDNRAHLLAEVGARFGAEKIYSHHHTLLHDEAIEGVVICVHRRCVGELTREAIEAGKPVLAEKPMATTHVRAAALVEAAEGRHLPYAVGFMKRHDPGVRAFKECMGRLVNTGELGKIVHVSLRDFCPTYAVPAPPHLPTAETKPYRYPEGPAAPDGLPSEWHADYDYSLNVLTHDLDLLGWLLGGALAPLSFRVRTRRTQVAHLTAGDFDVILQAGRSDPGVWDQSLDIFFERGQMTLRLPSPLARQEVASGEIRAPGRNECVVLPPAQRRWAFSLQLEAFASAIHRRSALEASGRNVLPAHAVLEQLWLRCDWCL